jgi:hypothetical protein
MKQFPQKIIAGLIFASALLGVQAQAEIQTSIIANDYRTSSEEIKNFSGATPCYLIIDKKHPDNYAKIIEIFKQAGFNITIAWNAQYTYQVRSYRVANQFTSTMY